MTDRVATMCYSDDGGHTFNNTRDRELGEIGQHQVRTKWERLGSSYTRTYDFTTTAGVIADLIGMETK